MQYNQAKDIAVKILKALQPFCRQVDIAGSIRREKPEVKDIEICLIPRITEIKDLFGEILNFKRSNEFVRSVKMQGVILKGDVLTGRYVQIALHEGINLDLFIPVETDYFRQYAIRTGSAMYSHKVLANAWLRIGWAGTENGLRRQSESYQQDLGNGKHRWICNALTPTLPPIFKNEYDLFQFLNLKWIEPKHRTV